MMDFIKSTWLLVAFACLMLLILSGCIQMTVQSDTGEVDATIRIQPTSEAVENTVMDRELDTSVQAEISIPIENSSNNSVFED